MAYISRHLPVLSTRLLFRNQTCSFVNSFESNFSKKCLCTKYSSSAKESILKKNLLVYPSHECQQTHKRNIGSSLPHINKNWYTVTYVKTDGERITVKGKEGDSLLDTATNNNVDLDGFGACEGTLSCSTCHLIFKKEDFDNIPDPVTDEELDMLDLAYGLTDTTKIQSLSFAGCGFLSLYLMGAAECLQYYCPRLLQGVPLSGASSGSLVAACIACQVPLQTLAKVVLETATVAHQFALGPFSPSFRIEDHLRKGLSYLPHDAHIRAQGRLFISLTRLKDLKNEIASDWGSRNELIECLLCSCFIPVFSGVTVPTYRGVKYLDGGFTDDLPIHSQPCLSVSPFAGDCTISPKDWYAGKYRFRMGNHAMYPTGTNLRRFIQALVPPPVKHLETIKKQGYNHALSFLKKKV